MKYPKIVAAVEILEDFVVQVKFDSGENRTVDFRQLPLSGVFKKIKTDKSFFNTIYLKDGYLMWSDDLTLDSDFIFDHSMPKQKATAFLVKVAKVANRIKQK